MTTDESVWLVSISPGWSSSGGGTDYCIFLACREEQYSYRLYLNPPQLFGKEGIRPPRWYATRARVEQYRTIFDYQDSRLVFESLPTNSSRDTRLFYTDQDFLAALQDWLPAIPHLKLFLALSELVEHMHALFESLMPGELVRLENLPLTGPLKRTNMDAVTRLEWEVQQASVKLDADRADGEVPA